MKLSSLHFNRPVSMLSVILSKLFPTFYITYTRIQRVSPSDQVQKVLISPWCAEEKAFLLCGMLEAGINSATFFLTLFRGISVLKVLSNEN